MDRSRYRDERDARSGRDRYRQDSPVRSRRDRSRSRSRDRERDRNRDRGRIDRNDRFNRRSPEREDKRNRYDDRHEKMSNIEKVAKTSIEDSSSVREKSNEQKPYDETKIADKNEETSSKDIVTKTPEVEVLHEEDLKAMESFMNEEGEEDEEDEVERLLRERKMRRQEILSKHGHSIQQSTNVVPSATSSHASVTVEDPRSLPHPQHTAQQALMKEEAQVTVTATAKAFENEAFRQLEAEKSALEAENVTGKRYSTTFDIFSSSPSNLERELRKPGAPTAAAGLSDALHGSEDPHLQSNWDDSEGYYRTRVGEVILDRYRTLGVVGKGVFSTVLKCADITKPVSTDDVAPAKPTTGPVVGGLVSESKVECVAIKMIRNNDTMRKAADKELAILTLLSKNDPASKKHCVQLLERFEFRSHTALVFEYQPMNLREILKKFGKDVGINIGAIRLYTRQLLVALRYLIDLKIVHADIKLDNILCSADLKQVKLCDFGSAFFENDPDSVPTPYLVSRFYRAPEIILGQPYDHAIDLWSVAVSAYELFTGHLMFPGRSNNEMLKLFMAVKGRFPNKQLRAHLRQYETMGLDPHFGTDLRFKQYDLDPVTGQASRRLVEITQPSRDLTSMLRSAKAGGDDGQLVGAFAQLLDQCIALDPSKRLSVHDALKHPFFTGK